MTTLVSSRTTPRAKRQRDVPLRIALMLPNLEIGGSQEVVRGLARHFADDGCEPVVCALFQGGPLERNLAAQGTTFEVFDLSRRPMRKLPLYISDMWRMWWRLRRFFIQHRVNVIQTNNLGSQDFLVLSVARHLKIPVVTFNFHDERIFPADRQNHPLTRLQRRMYRRGRSRVQDYVAVSPETKRAMVDQLKLDSETVTVICNGVDVDRYDRAVDREGIRSRLGLDADAKLLLTVGTLKEQKGHRYLIDAAKRIVREEPQAHFLFAGDGVLRESLERQSNERGMAEHIHFLGSRRDVSELLMASDVFVLPSLFEGLSIALLEAMAAKIPVVATDVSGTSTVVNSEDVGTLIPPKNVELLETAIIETLRRPPSSVNAQCQAAHDRVVEQFSLQRQANDYLALYDDLMADVS